MHITLRLFFFSKHLSTGFIISFGFLEPVSRKSRKLFGPEKPFVELRPTYSVKLVFSYVVKGIKINITAMFRASRRLSFEDTKRIPSPEMRPISFGTFEKRAPGHSATRKFRSPPQFHLSPTTFVLRWIHGAASWTIRRSLMVLWS